MEPIKIVVRYVDGRVVRGYNEDFNPNQLSFHLYRDPPTEIRIKEEGLKAIFLVRTFQGNPHYRERKEFAEGDRPYGCVVEVTFGDGEVMQGSIIGHDPQRPGFFLLPSDLGCNNLNMFVLSSAVKDFRYLNGSRIL